MGCDPLDPTREGEIDVVAAIRNNGMRGVDILTRCAACSFLPDPVNVKLQAGGNLKTVLGHQKDIYED